MRKYRYVHVKIDLGEIGDDDLIAELKERKSKEAEDSLSAESELREDLIWIHDALRDGRIADAVARLERIIWPVHRVIKPKRAA